MTLTVDETGAFSGQLTATAGPAGSVSGKIAAQGADGIADITTVFGDQSKQDFTRIVIIQNNGHLGGNMPMPLNPGGVPAVWILASFDLTRQ